MKFEKEARELYNIAHNYASKDRRAAAYQHKYAHPETLSSILDEKKIAYTFDVGTMNIPIDKIAGVVTPSEKDSLYTADFLPLAPASSEFANKWRKLYLEYLSDEGIRKPIGCYEYLGRFYVSDGLMRVSVLKSYGASTISARVIRLVPVRTEESKIQCYYEFLKHFRLTRLYQVSFNQPENFAKLQAALGYEPNHAWTEMDRFSFMFHWYSFDRAFKKIFGEDQHVTAADMLVAVLEDYSYSEVRKMHPWDLEKVLQSAWKKIYGTSNLGLGDVFKKVS